MNNALDANKSFVKVNPVMGKDCANFQGLAACITDPKTLSTVDNEQFRDVGVGDESRGWFI